MSAKSRRYNDPRPRDPPEILESGLLWGKPSFAKRSHAFDEKGSLCGRYDAHEIPELFRRPVDYDRVCEGCLLAVAKADPRILMRAKYGASKPDQG